MKIKFFLSEFLMVAVTISYQFRLRPRFENGTRALVYSRSTYCVYTPRFDFRLHSDFIRHLPGAPPQSRSFAVNPVVYCLHESFHLWLSFAVDKWVDAAIGSHQCEERIIHCQKDIHVDVLPERQE